MTPDRPTHTIADSGLADRIRQRYWGPGPTGLWRRVIETSPRFFVAYCRWRGLGGNPLDDDTDLVIDGPPGSANSYAREVLREANPGFGVASHLHTPAHLREGVRRGLPSVALLRDADSSVLSILSRHPEYLGRLDWAIHSHLKDWETFFRRLRPALSDILLLRFDEVTRYPEAYAKAINDRFGLALTEPTPEIVTAAMERLRRWEESLFGEDAAARTSTPDNQRDDLRQAISERMNTDAHRALRARCAALSRELDGHVTRLDDTLTDGG